MAKGGKSSATSATRKKHARKAAGNVPAEEPVAKEKKPKTKAKGRNKEPRKKVYIPPLKPAPVQPDPLDTTGLAHRLPPELLVVLRNLSKKAEVTKARALEELQSAWIDKCQNEGEDSPLVYTLVDMLPVWFHHLAALFAHPSRRIRLLVANLHLSLLQIPPLRDQMFFFIREAAAPHQIENILGTWCMITFDVDRAVASCASKSWNTFLSVGEDVRTDTLLLDKQLRVALLEFCQRSLLDPTGIYNYLNPPQPSIDPTPPRKSSGRRGHIPQIKEDSELTARHKTDEAEETVQDLKGRLRVGAFGALKWAIDLAPSELPSIMINPALWSSLSSAKACPFAELESFGYEQPVVRKAAWSLVQSLVQRQKDVVGAILPLLSTAILRSAWVEPDSTVQVSMWQPLLIFLRAFPNCWDLETIFDSTGPDDEDDSGSDAEDTEGPKQDVKTTGSISHPYSVAYRGFLQFLELGCSGSPLQGYPAVVIILSSIPLHMLNRSTSPLRDFFDSFWAAIDGRALSSLQRHATSAAFLSSLLECLLMAAKRLRGRRAESSEFEPGRSTGDSMIGQSDITSVVSSLVTEQYAKIWSEISSKNLKITEEDASKLLVQSLDSFVNYDSELFDVAWSQLVLSVRSGMAKSLTLSPNLLKVLHDQWVPESHPAVCAKSLLVDVLFNYIGDAESILETGGPDSAQIISGVAPLTTMLDTLGKTVFCYDATAKRLDDLVSNKAHGLLVNSTSILILYFVHRHDEGRVLSIWHTLLSDISEQSEFIEALLNPWIDAACNGRLPDCIKHQSFELDPLILELLYASLSHPDGSSTRLTKNILMTSEFFLSGTGFKNLLRVIIESVSSRVDSAIHDVDGHLQNLKLPLEYLRIIIKRNTDSLGSPEIPASLWHHIFYASYLIPSYDPLVETDAVDIAQQLWALYHVHVSNEVYAEIKASLRTLLKETQVWPTVHHIFDLVTQKYPGIQFDFLTDIFPSQSEIDAMLASLSPDPADASLGVLNSLVIPTSLMKCKRPVGGYDKQGFSSYARLTVGLLHYCLQNRQSARSNLWVLRHLLSLSIYASEFVNIPSAGSPLFSEQALHNQLPDYIERVQQIVAYLLTTPLEVGWRIPVLAALQQAKSRELPTGLPSLLAAVVTQSMETDSSRDSRILHLVLQHVLDDIEVSEADNWIAFARKIERSSPLTSMVIIASITETGSEPPRLDRYRNEMAAGLTGVPASKVSTDGLLYLRRLAASAPDQNSGVPFLPEQRAVNLVKACQAWVTSDEDIDEEVENEMTLVFLHLAPILQNVPGAHWDFIFDVIENSLENSGLAEDSSLMNLARTLRLTIMLEDLVLTNKALRAVWQERRPAILRMIKDLATCQIDELPVSTPRSTCLQLMLTLLQDLPDALVDHETLPQLCHLLNNPSTEIQTMSYPLLQSAAKKRTEHLVLETGVDLDGSVKVELPAELIDFLSWQISSNDDNIDAVEQNEQVDLGHLLGWMIVFDLFVNASVKVRSGYVDQLRSLGIFSKHFIPRILTLLRLDGNVGQALKLNIWAVDEYFVQYYDSGDVFSLQLLAAHLYYRSLMIVPSLVYSWVLDCKDRRLASNIATYTSQYFSPVLIDAELAHVKDSDTAADIKDDNFSIKVASSIREVTASYTVDEHQLEIKLKIPQDWPLHRIEVKDTKRVGVDEQRWRAWILAVQQTVWSHNGRILDGISLFKKNVSLHFEGQVECAICYSIISVMDGSFPRKPCGTCKNRFHAACLYKWFNTSHSSSCPLCRSNII